jgi:serine/threonine protein kinase
MNILCINLNNLIGENYTSKADIFSLGIVLYYMYFKEFPFKEFSVPKLIRRI